MLVSWELQRVIFCLDGMGEFPFGGPACAHESAAQPYCMGRTRCRSYGRHGQDVLSGSSLRHRFADVPFDGFMKSGVRRLRPSRLEAAMTLYLVVRCDTLGVKMCFDCISDF